MPALDERAVLPRQLLHDRVVLGALMSPHVDDVAVSLGRDHPGPRAAVLEDRVGGDGRPVKDVADVAGRDPVPLAELADAGRRPRQRRSSSPAVPEPHRPGPMRSSSATRSSSRHDGARPRRGGRAATAYVSSQDNLDPPAHGRAGGRMTASSRSSSSSPTSRGGGASEGAPQMFPGDFPGSTLGLEFHALAAELVRRRSGSGAPCSAPAA